MAIVSLKETRFVCDKCGSYHTYSTKIVPTLPKNWIILRFKGKDYDLCEVCQYKLARFLDRNFDE